MLPLQWVVRAKTAHWCIAADRASSPRAWPAARPARACAASCGDPRVAVAALRPSRERSALGRPPRRRRASSGRTHLAVLGAAVVPRVLIARASRAGARRHGLAGQTRPGRSPASPDPRIARVNHPRDARCRVSRQSRPAARHAAPDSGGGSGAARRQAQRDVQSRPRGTLPIGRHSRASHEQCSRTGCEAGRRSSRRVKGDGVRWRRRPRVGGGTETGRCLS